MAVDGTKIAAAATHHATRSYEQIAREILEEAARIDAAEDELYGEARGDELPEGLRTSGDRRKGPARGQAGAGGRARRAGREGPARPRERLVECRRRLRQDWELERHVVGERAAWHAAGIASDGSRRMVGARHNIKPYPLLERAGGQDQRDRPGLAQPQDDARVGAGLQRPGRRRRRPDHSRREISAESLDTANLAPMIETAHRRARGGGVPRHPGWCWPTPATGRTTRSRRSAARASRRR